MLSFGVGEISNLS